MGPHVGVGLLVVEGIVLPENRETFCELLTGLEHDGLQYILHYLFEQENQIVNLYSGDVDKDRVRYYLNVMILETSSLW